MDWYYSVQGDRQGPVELETLKNLVERGGLKPDDYVWNASMGSDWTPVSQVPALAGLKPESTAASRQAELNKRMEERRKAEAAAKQRRLLVLIGVVVVVAGIIGAIVFVKKNELKWKHGISASSPIGSLAKIEKVLLEELKMDEEPGSACYLVKMPQATLRKFSNSKMDRGEHVSNQGSITLMADGDRLVGVYAEFPSPGQHGMAFINKSVTFLFMEKYWMALGGPKEPSWRGDKNRPPDLAETFGLSGVPARGGYHVIETGPARGIWHMHGLEQIRTFVYVHPAG